jgi:hypothetical protein
MKEILKNNILSIICGVVAIAALVVPFWPMGGYRDELQSRLTERANVYTSLEGLRTKTRNLPVVDPNKPDPIPLDGFPNENVIAKGEEVKKGFETQSTQLTNEALKINTHKLLVPGSLPTPVNNAVAINFRDSYRGLILPTTNQLGQIVNGGIAQSWKVGLPPTQQDIQLAVQNLFRTKYQPQLGGALPGVTNDRMKQALNDEFNQEAARVPDQERNKVAMNSLLYMNPDALPYIQSFNNGGAPQPLDMWNAQVDLWIIQDVGDGIKDANAGAKNVTEAAVKHLIKINIAHPNPYVVQGGQSMDGELTGPAPKVFDLGQQAQQGGPEAGTVSMMTGRVCNPLYDVVQYQVIMNVDATKIPQVMEALSHNRFVTVVKASVQAVDSAALKQQGYMYGDVPVVQLTLRCEDVFFHKWERPLMPKAMADLMAGVQPGGGGGEGGGMIEY